MSKSPWSWWPACESPWASRRKIKLADLVNEPWTWSPRGTVVDLLVRGAFTASGLTPPSACVHTHAAGVWMGLAATGRFVAVVAPSLLKSSARHTSVKVLPVDLPGTQQQIVVLTLKNRTLSPLAAAVHRMRAAAWQAAGAK